MSISIKEAYVFSLLVLGEQKIEIKKIHFDTPVGDDSELLMSNGQTGFTGCILPGKFKLFSTAKK